MEGRMRPGEHGRGREMGSKGGGPTVSRRLRRPFSGSIRTGWVGGGAGEGTIWSLGGVNLGHLDACAHTPPPPSHPPTRPDRRQIGACMGPAHVVSCPRGGSHSSTHSIPTCGQLKCVHAPYHLTSPPSTPLAVGAYLNGYIRPWRGLRWVLAVPLTTKHLGWMAYPSVAPVHRIKVRICGVSALPQNVVFLTKKTPCITVHLTALNGRQASQHHCCGV